MSPAENLLAIQLEANTLTTPQDQEKGSAPIFDERLKADLQLLITHICDELGAARFGGATTEAWHRLDAAATRASAALEGNTSLYDADQRRAYATPANFTNDIQEVGFFPIVLEWALKRLKDPANTFPIMIHSPLEPPEFDSFILGWHIWCENLAADPDRGWADDNVYATQADAEARLSAHVRDCGCSEAKVEHYDSRTEEEEEEEEEEGEEGEEDG